MNKSRLSLLFIWLLQILGYCAILIVTSWIFDGTMYIDNSNYGLWCLLATLLVYIFNKTIKPLLVWLTIPITGITLGLFYPFINLIILKLVSFILTPHFVISGIWFALFASILISLLNVMMEEFIFKNIKWVGDNK